MVIIYGRPLCNWCDLAKDLCNTYKIEYEYKNIKNELYLNELKDLAPNVNTVPQIFWDGRYIGGYSEFVDEVDNTRGGFGDGF